MRVTLGPSASDQWLHAPDHLAMVLARYRAASALIGTADSVLEVGCGEGIGAPLLWVCREYHGIDPDPAAIETATSVLALSEDGDDQQLSVSTIEDLGDQGERYHAAVALDVIEHVADGAAFLDAIVRQLWAWGVCVIGTPNAAFDHLASPQSRAGHVKTYTQDELYQLMTDRFMVVQSFGMQDTALHVGHPEARHYLLLCGIGL